MAITDEPGVTDETAPLWKKWAWFIGLWAFGVAAVGAVGWLLRWWLHP